MSRFRILRRIVGHDRRGKQPPASKPRTDTPALRLMQIATMHNATTFGLTGASYRIITRNQHPKFAL